MRIKKRMLEKRVGYFLEYGPGFRTRNGKGLIRSDCTSEGRRRFVGGDGTLAYRLEVTRDPVNQTVTERAELFGAELQWCFSMFEVIKAHVCLRADLQRDLFQSCGLRLPC